MILLVETYGTKWGPAKGTREGNESTTACAKREAYEETGISVTEQQLKNSLTWMGYRSLIHYVPFQHDSMSEYVPRDTKEITGIRWFHLDEIDKLTLNCVGRCSIDYFHKVIVNKLK